MSKNVPSHEASAIFAAESARVEWERVFLDLSASRTDSLDALQAYMSACRARHELGAGGRLTGHRLK